MIDIRKIPEYEVDKEEKQKITAWFTCKCFYCQKTCHIENCGYKDCEDCEANNCEKFKGD